MVAYRHLTDVLSGEHDQLVLLAENRLSLPTEDRVTPLRVGFFVQFLLIVAWIVGPSIGAPRAPAVERGRGARRHRRCCTWPWSHVHGDRGPGRVAARVREHEAVAALALARDVPSRRRTRRRLCAGADGLLMLAGDRFELRHG